MNNSSDNDRIICKWCAGLGRLAGDEKEISVLCPDCDGHGYHVVHMNCCFAHAVGGGECV